MLTIDGRQGEGGGQVLRTCLSLSALTGRPFRLEHIRANRSKPGLRPQHLTAVRAVARICHAEVEGDAINAATLEFRPQTPPRGGVYQFDVRDAALHGSAGAVTLVFQAVLPPLLFADAPSRLSLHGGTHVPFSPPFHYLDGVVRPALARLGATFSLALDAWGWIQAGGGEITAEINPVSHLQAVDFEPGERNTVRGVAAVTNLPSHIPNRMARRADNLLRERGFNPAIQTVRARGDGPGAGIVLWATGGGADSLGRPGLPADKVAETAVADLLAFIDNGADLDPHLADQLLLPLALADGRSRFTTSRLTGHTLTSAALLRRWLEATIDIEGQIDEPGRVIVNGIALKRNEVIT